MNGGLRTLSNTADSLPHRRANHPAGTPAGQVRFATCPSNSLPLCSTSMKSAGNMSRWSPPSLGPAGTLVAGFRPDFYLPDRGVFIELTTADQRLVTRKNGKVAMRGLYPRCRSSSSTSVLCRAPRVARGGVALIVSGLVWPRASGGRRGRRGPDSNIAPSCGPCRAWRQDGPLRRLGDAAGLSVGNDGRTPGLP